MAGRTSRRSPATNSSSGSRMQCQSWQAPEPLSNTEEGRFLQRVVCLVLFTVVRRERRTVVPRVSRVLGVRHVACEIGRTGGARSPPQGEGEAAERGAPPSR